MTGVFYHSVVHGLFVAETLFLVMFPGVAKSAGNKPKTFCCPGG